MCGKLPDLIILNLQAWKHFEGHIPADERSDLVAAYHNRLTSADTAVRDDTVSLPFYAFHMHS